jgi:AAA+ superfamily predicted ATPase
MERLSALRAAAEDGDPVIVVYGPGVDDAFVDTSYRICSIEEAIWETLRQAGYQRIAFYSLNRKLYFRDDESLRASRPAGTAVRSPPARPRTMRPGFRGPLADLVIAGPGATAALGSQADAPLDRKAAQRDGQGAALPDTRSIDTPMQAPAIPGATAQSLADPFSVQILKHLLGDGSVRTAVVFVHAEETLSYLQAMRELAGVFAERVAYRPKAPHTAVLLMRSPTRDGVHDFLDGLRNVPALASHVRQQSDRPGRSHPVGHPGDAELSRMIHALHAADGLRVADWRWLPALVRAMAAQAVEARTWERRLRGLAEKETPLDAASLSIWIGSVVEGPDTVWDRLDRMPGLDAVKQHLARLRWRLEADARLRAEGKVDAEPGSHHLVFTGNPGTGKTTVARLVGEMYRDMGLLSRGHCVEAHVSDMVAEHVGGTSPKTNALVDRALDGVLFIDEAYQLSDQARGFGQDAIDTLLARMENDRSRLVVIVAGYPAKMKELLDANQGLRSRFPPANVILFPDYDPAILLRILLTRLGALGLTWTDEMEAHLGTVVAAMYRARDPDFGNARDMRTIADEICANWASRVKGGISQPADIADLPERLLVYTTRHVPAMADLLGELDAMIGLAPVKESIRSLVNRVTLAQRRGRGEVVAPHLLFLGPPGTGKTTVARLLGQIFRTLGLLTKGHVVEVGRKDLVAGYIGQTALKTAERIDEAMDGVLFIDEAYSLARGGDGRDFGQDAIDTLTQEMENRRGRLVVIAAGYPQPIMEFVASNQGLASRFAVQIEFPDYSAPELLQILQAMATREGYTLTIGAQERALGWFTAMRAARPNDFGNGRAVRGLLELMEDRLGERTADAELGPGELNTFQAEDVPDVP